MKRYLIFLLFCSIAQASEVFERDHDANSVVLAPICVPALSGQGWATVDFDTASLNVTIIASGDGAYQAFDFSGGNIDDGPADFTWGNPAANAIEIDAIATGASAGCISLSIRDEVLAVASATEWSITFTDGETALMDHEAFIRIKDATGVALTTAQSDLDTLTGSDGATISTASIQAFWDIQCEDQDGGLTCQEAMSILLAECCGTAVYTSSTRTWVVKDPSGTETRFTLVYDAALDGSRTTSTLAPITP